MNIKKDILWRIGLAYMLLILLGVAIVWKVFVIQSIEGEQWRSMADSVTTKYVTVDAERGNIYSFDQRLLATSLPSFEVHQDMKADGLSKEIFYNNIDSLSFCMANLFGDKSSADYRKQFLAARQRGDRYFLVKRNLTFPQLIVLKSFPIFRLGQFKGGLIITQRGDRFYPYDQLANRTIGSVRNNGIKPVGLEATFDSLLSGKPGKRLMQKVSGGDFLPLNDKNEIDPQNGKDVITTIDVNLQDVAEHALMNTLVANNADHGCVVVMDVKTGAIRAIANLGKNSNGSYTEKQNYAVGEAHEPGSTFKLASMIALLEDGYVGIHDTVDLELGIHQYWKQTMRDAEHHGLRRVDVKSAFAHSSNVGISKLIYSHYNKNPEKYLQHLRDLKLDQKLNLEIAGAANPYIKNTKDKTFTQYSLPWMAVGYELQVSPLQLLTLYNAVANNGVMVKPYLVNEIDEYGKPVKQFQPTILNPKICSDKTLQSLQEILKAVVDSGTARNLRNPNYSIAGKTGTAQIADETHGYETKVYQSSFVGFFPAENPMYSCIVVVNAPSNGVYYGALVSGPVFKEIADVVYATNLDVHPSIDAIADNNVNAILQTQTGYKSDLQTVFTELGMQSQSIADNTWVTVNAKGNTLEFQNKNVIEQTGVVPDVKGMGLRDALYLLENSGLNVNVSGAGEVISQSIKPGTKILKGQNIIIALSL